LNVDFPQGLPGLCGPSISFGGLLACGTSLSVLFRRARSQVDKILNGIKPGDFPVEQPIPVETDRPANAEV
jgi:hypothetical protein